MEKVETELKVSAVINLGEFNPIEERDRALAQLNNLSDKLEAERRFHAEEGEALREKLHKQELEVLRLSLQMQIDTIARMIAEAPRNLSFTEQLAAFRKLADELGYSPTKKGG